MKNLDHLRLIYEAYLPVVMKIARETDNGDYYLDKIASGRMALNEVYRVHDYTHPSFPYYVKMFVTNYINNHAYMKEHPQ